MTEMLGIINNTLFADFIFGPNSIFYNALSNVRNFLFKFRHINDNI